MKTVRIAEDLSLPVDLATQTLLVVGKRGSGKSTTAARIVEQLLKAKVPVAVLDPVDTWWGLKASRDGSGDGHGVYVFGGRHADLPLEPGAGAVIAEFLCEHRAPVVLSCKHFSGLERSQFMVDFALTLFRKWTGGVLHLVLEEAHELAPQNPPKAERAEHMLGAFKRLWKLGRSSGIGGTAITQRPASLHKDITTQSEVLVVHRTIGPQDVAAVKEWIKYHQQGEEILPELAHLKTGEAFVWGPEFPEGAPIGLRRVQVLPRETFDSSFTPKHGEQRAEPQGLAPVDLERLRDKMSATIERARSEDPKELRRALAETKKKLADQIEVTARQAGVIEKLEERPAKGAAKGTPAIKEADLQRLEKLIDKINEGFGRFNAEDQTNADERVPLLLQTPAAIRFLSIEPQLGPVRPALQRSTCCGNTWLSYLPGSMFERSSTYCPTCGFAITVHGSATNIHQVIQGGESGPEARPFRVEWARALRDQCFRTDGIVAYFLKQLGSVPTFNLKLEGWPEHVEFRQDTRATNIIRLRDRKGGDMSEWSEDLRVREFPQVSA